MTNPYRQADEADSQTAKDMSTSESVGQLCADTWLPRCPSQRRRASDRCLTHHPVYAMALRTYGYGATGLGGGVHGDLRAGQRGRIRARADQGAHRAQARRSRPTARGSVAPARSTTPMPPNRESSQRKASRPPTSRKCWGSPAPPRTATSPRTAQPRTCGAAAPCSTPIRPPLARRMKANGETTATICETVRIGRTTLYRVFGRQRSILSRHGVGLIVGAGMR